MTARTSSHITTIDAYLAALAARLTIEPVARATILEEVRGHLLEATDAAVARGVAAAEAEAQAVAAFGAVATTARSFNAALPVHWDIRRMAWGVGVGALAIWLVWTLVTFPFVVQLAAEHRLNMTTSPGGLLFTASPLAYGLFYALRDGPWAALLILTLFGAIAAILGSRARHGWRAGLAFGLGVVVGMPFLPLALVFAPAYVSPLALLPIIGAIWLLVPYAVLAAWLGARIGRLSALNALRRPPSTARLMRASAVTARNPRRLPATILVGLTLLLALLAVNGWSFVRAAAPAPAAMPVAQQLANAQRSLPFTIRQPGYLPAGVVLSDVQIGQAWCGYCSISLVYRAPHGARLSLIEIPQRLPVATATVASAALNFSLFTGTFGGYHPVWWLGGEVTTERQVNLTWDDGALNYFLGTDGAWQADTLKEIAFSLYR